MWTDFPEFNFEKKYLQNLFCLTAIGRTLEPELGH